LPPIGWFAVYVVCPSFEMLCVSAVAMSDSVLLAHVELIVVPVDTGFPAGRL
jgi:hypothetical protein